MYDQNTIGMNIIDWFNMFDIFEKCTVKTKIFSDLREFLRICIDLKSVTLSKYKWNVDAGCRFGNTISQG